MNFRVSIIRKISLNLNAEIIIIYQLFFLQELSPEMDFKESPEKIQNNKYTRMQSENPNWNSQNPNPNPNINTNTRRPHSGHPLGRRKIQKTLCQYRVVFSAVCWGGGRPVDAGLPAPDNRRRDGGWGLLRVGGETELFWV